MLSDRWLLFHMYVFINLFTHINFIIKISSFLFYNNTSIFNLFINQICNNYFFKKNRKIKKIKIYFIYEQLEHSKLKKCFLKFHRID